MPGQTRFWWRGVDARSCHPSMEGRTIARPDLPDGREAAIVPYGLQWRAGQLPGQTQKAETISLRQ